MSEVKITTSGELHLDGDIVGRIEWLRPYVEGSVAGTYDFDEMVDEWGNRIDCANCEELQDKLGDLESPANGQVVPLIAKMRKEALTKEGVLMSSIDALGAVICKMDFEL